MSAGLLAGGTIPAGQTARSFAVTVNGAATTEPKETSVVRLSDASGATLQRSQAVGAILSDD